MLITVMSRVCCAGLWFAQCSYNVENCWSGQIPHLFELELLVSVLRHRKPSILRELPAWLLSPSGACQGRVITLLLLSSIRRRTLSTLEHKQVPGASQLRMPPPQNVMECSLFITRP